MSPFLAKLGAYGVQMSQLSLTQTLVVVIIRMVGWIYYVGVLRSESGPMYIFYRAGKLGNEYDYWQAKVSGINISIDSVLELGGSSNMFCVLSFIIYYFYLFVRRFLCWPEMH